MFPRPQAPRLFGLKVTSDFYETCSVDAEVPTWRNARCRKDVGDDLLDTDAEFNIVTEPYSLAPVDRMYLILRLGDDLGALHGRKDIL